MLSLLTILVRNFSVTGIMLSFIHDLTLMTLHFVQEHQNWALPVIFILAFCESLAFISLLVPATVILIGVGTLVGAGALSFFWVWLFSSLGAILGDTISYYFGKHYHDAILHLWPLSNHPKLIENGKDFFYKYGAASVFIGRFFGPFRAIVPLIAGITLMPNWLFNLANITSGLLWSFAILAPGVFGIHWLKIVLG